MAQSSGRFAQVCIQHFKTGPLNKIENCIPFQADGPESRFASFLAISDYFNKSLAVTRLKRHI